MAKNKESAAYMTNRAFSHAIGISDTAIRSDNVKGLFNTLSRYTDHEQQALLRNLHVPQPTQNTRPIDAATIKNLFEPAFKTIGQKKESFRKLRAICPEISKASSIRVSSIMSPNDLQNGKFIFSIENMEGLSNDIKQEITSKLDTFFNDVLKLGKLAEDWCDRCLYGVGSVPIFLYPSTSFLSLKESGLLSDDGTLNGKPKLYKPGKKVYGKELTRGTEDFKIFEREVYHDLEKELNKRYTRSTFEKMVDSSPFSKVRGTEAFEKEFEDRFSTYVRDELITDTYYDVKDQLGFTNGDGLKELSAGLEATKVTLTKLIEEGDVIKLTENPEIIKFANEYKRFNKQKIQTEYSRFIDENEGTLTNSVEYKPEELISFLQHTNNNIPEIGHPFWMVLPSESVFPLTVPGDPKSKIGYIVLLDENGYPLEYDPLQDQSQGNGCCGGKVDAAYQTMFRNSCNRFNSTFKNQSQMITSTMFSHLIDGYIKAKLTKFGFDSLDVNKTNSIASMMFARLLLKKKTHILYVPPMFMTYLAFDYHADGTGKSLLDDIEFTLSLKATFLVASIMAMANDSLNHHTVELTFEDKAVNYEQLIDQVVNAHVSKKKFNMSTNPEDIATAIARNHLTVSPKNMSGIQNFDIKTETTPGNSVQPNTELINILDNMQADQLGVPYASLNNTGDTEYSRSILTNNLFFSKQIYRDKGTVCHHIGDFTKSFVANSKILKSMILNILAKNGSVTDEPTEGTKTSSLDDTDTRNSYGKQLAAIVENITVTLPITGVAPDRALITELEEYFNNIEKLANVVFSDEIIPTDDNKARDALKIIRASWKRKFAIDYFNRMGVSDNIKIPTDDDIAIEQNEWADNLQFLNNIITGLEHHRKIFTPHQDGDGFGGGGFSEGGDEMGAGMDEGFGDEFGSGDETPPAMNDSLPDEPSSGSSEESDLNF